VMQTRDGIVDVQAVLRLRRRLHVPADQRQAERGCEILGEQRLAGARLAAYEQRATECDRDVDRVAQLLGGDIRLRALELIELLLGHTSEDLSAFSGSCAGH